MTQPHADVLAQLNIAKLIATVVDNIVPMPELAQRPHVALPPPEKPRQGWALFVALTTAAATALCFADKKTHQGRKLDDVFVCTAMLLYQAISTNLVYVNDDHSIHTPGGDFTPLFSVHVMPILADLAHHIPPEGAPWPSLVEFMDVMRLGIALDSESGHA